MRVQIDQICLLGSETPRLCRMPCNSLSNAASSLGLDSEASGGHSTGLLKSPIRTLGNTTFLLLGELVLEALGRVMAGRCVWVGLRGLR
jgi:hypothetical protein